MQNFIIVWYNSRIFAATLLALESHPLAADEDFRRCQFCQPPTSRHHWTYLVLTTMKMTIISFQASRVRMVRNTLTRMWARAFAITLYRHHRHRRLPPSTRPTQPLQAWLLLLTATTLAPMPPLYLHRHLFWPIRVERVTCAASAWPLRARSCARTASATRATDRRASTATRAFSGRYG